MNKITLKEAVKKNKTLKDGSLVLTVGSSKMILSRAPWDKSLILTQVISDEEFKEIIENDLIVRM